MTDLGVSAFRGANQTEGYLGQFLSLVQAGQIPEGSVLICESLDRLSRQEVLESLELFLSIIRGGIRLVTLTDGMIYDKESISQNWTQLIISLTVMSRAHEESLLKSGRISAAWAEKRDQARKGGRKITARAPAWLQLSEDKTEFSVIPEAAEVIELIFRSRLEGISPPRIEKKLNEMERIWTPPLTGKLRTGGWRESYIWKILASKAVIGHFQPHKGGKPAGEPILDYFPPVIDQELFYQVQALIKENARKPGYGGGKTGKANNLFTHVIKCGICGYPLHYVNRGRPPRGGRYIHCDNSKRLKKCPARAINYDEFEKLIFQNLEELDVQGLLPAKNDFLIKQNSLKRKLTATRQMILETSQEIENYMDTIGRTEDSRIREQLEKRLSRGFDNKEKLESEVKELGRELSAMEQPSNGLDAGIEQSLEIYKLMESAKDEQERIDLRIRLRQQIRKIVARIDIYPLLEPYQEVQETEEPGIYKIMRSKRIDKIRIQFKGSRNFRMLYLKNHAELLE